MVSKIFTTKLIISLVFALPAAHADETKKPEATNTTKTVQVKTTTDFSNTIINASIWTGIFLGASLMVPRLVASNPRSVSEFGQDMLDMAKKGNFDYFFGRLDEIRKLIQLASRSNKPNILLVGEAGAGKTALAEGLAKFLVDPENAKYIPPGFQKVRYLSISTTDLIANTKWRGQLEAN